VQDHFLRFWQEVARKFTGNTYVLGYELLNEPWAGDIYRHPDQLLPSTADSRNLEPMYARLHSAIREYDDQHIIFFEPTIIITSVNTHSIFEARGIFLIRDNIPQLFLKVWCIFSLFY
jgi:aryl-phospho-beta-D-glucosidase BglC (GH1 family)